MKRTKTLICNTKSKVAPPLGSQKSVSGRLRIHSWTSGILPTASMAAFMRGHGSKEALAPSALSKNPFGAARNWNQATSASETFAPTSQGPGAPAGKAFSMARTFSGSSSENHLSTAAFFSSSSLMPFAFWYAFFRSIMFSHSWSINAASTALAPMKPNSRAMYRSIALDCANLVPSTSRYGSLPSETSSSPACLAASNSGRLIVEKSPGVPKVTL
mmetsp:Transcript_82915/g.209012  ORF Transcript_82915/g.209012 Transcript_82915/m.209012 type:complete len:216 (+) Transcript_82915:207-854(+)